MTGWVSVYPSDAGQPIEKFQEDLEHASHLNAAMGGEAHKMAWDDWTALLQEKWGGGVAC